MLENKNLILKLFKEGKLLIDDASWYCDRGFSFLCSDGNLLDIVREET